MGKIWIPASGGDGIDLKETTADATAAADDIADGKTAYANGEKITGNIPIQIGETEGVGTPILNGSVLFVKIPRGIYKENAYGEENPLIIFPNAVQQKTVTPTKSKQNISADSGKLLNSVTVNPISDKYIDTSDANATASTILENRSAYVNGSKLTGTMTDQGAKTASLNAGGSYAIPAGYHNGSGKITANSLASQTDSTAGAGDILSGKTAWVKGSKLTGTMVNKGAVTGSVNCGGSYTIPAGYHNGSGKITGNSLASQTGVQSGKTAAGAGQILTGYEAWVNGGRVTGTMANQGAKTSSLNCGGSYTIPAGYHNGSGKITANSLSSQTSANAAANHLAKDKTAWVNGSKITGTVPDKRGTAQPVQYAQIRNNRFEIAVEPGIYGCNWVNNAQDYEYLSYQKVRDTIGLTAAKLKHNEGVLGLTGTFTSDANLEAGCLLSGYSGYSKGSKINGTMANRAITDSTIGGINSSYSNIAIHKGANPQFNTTTKSKERLFGIAPPSGYYNGAPYVGCPAQTKTVTPSTSSQTVRADNGVLEQVNVNAIPNNRGQYQYGANIGESGGSNGYYAINGLPEGYYVKNGADWAPEARISKDKMRSYFGISADKIKRGCSFMYVDGNVDRFIQYAGSKNSTSAVRYFTDAWGNSRTFPYIQLVFDSGFVPMSIAVFTNKTEKYEVVTQDPWHIILMNGSGVCHMYNYKTAGGISWDSTVRVPVTHSDTQYDYVINGYNNS